MSLNLFDSALDLTREQDSQRVEVIEESQKATASESENADNESAA